MSDRREASSMNSSLLTDQQEFDIRSLFTDTREDDGDNIIWTPSNLNLVEQLMLYGLTRREVAKLLHITENMVIYAQDILEKIQNKDDWSLDDSASTLRRRKTAINARKKYLKSRKLLSKQSQRVSAIFGRQNGVPSQSTRVAHQPLHSPSDGSVSAASTDEHRPHPRNIVKAPKPGSALALTPSGRNPSKASFQYRGSATISNHTLSATMGGLPVIGLDTAQYDETHRYTNVSGPSINLNLHIAGNGIPSAASRSKQRTRNKQGRPSSLHQALTERTQHESNVNNKKRKRDEIEALVVQRREEKAKAKCAKQLKRAECQTRRNQNRSWADKWAKGAVTERPDQP